MFAKVILHKFLFCLFYTSLLLVQNVCAQDAKEEYLSRLSTAKSESISGQEGNRYSAVLSKVIPTVDMDVSIDLPDRSVVAKKVTKKAVNTAVDAQIFSFNADKGMMLVTDMGDGRQEVRLHDAAQNRYFTGVTNKAGYIQLAEQDIHELICVEYYQAPNNTSESYHEDSHAEEIDDKSVNTLTDTPSSLTVNELKNLQSRPGAPNVLLVDYWGGVVSGTAWNDAYNASQPIPYDEFNVNGAQGGTDDFSANEKSIMYTGWASMAEDYAPFNINVTTSLAVFNATSESQRARLIVTPTIAWFDSTGQTGGVAYVGVFNNFTNYYKIGWSWAQDANQIGQINSHEAGHIMGLEHDGYSSVLEYYPGHGNWSSIMGGNSPFDINGSFQGFRDYSHWNNGTYNLANNTAENDLIELRSMLGVVADDVGDSNANAQFLNVEGDSFMGLIRPQGLGADTDVFRLHQANTSAVSIDVKPAFVDINNVESAQNLSMRVQVKNQSNQVVGQELPNQNPSLNRLSFTQTLSPGVYYISVVNESYNTSSTTGFPEYGNGGFYSVDVSGGFNSTAPDLVISEMLIQPNSVELDSGEFINLQVRAINGGINAATQYTVNFYQSTDTVIDNNDSLLGGQIINESLANGVISSQWQTSFAAPSGNGQYYYGACLADVVPSELASNDNCSQAVTLSVGEEFCLPLTASNGNVAVICL